MTIIPNIKCAYNAAILAIQADGWECVGAGGHGKGGAFYQFRKGHQLRTVICSRARIMTDFIGSAN